MSESSTDKRERGSDYRVVVESLKKQGVLSEPIVSPRSTPEDLNSRHLFPYEPSREPTIYGAINHKKAHLSED